MGSRTTTTASASPSGRGLGPNVRSRPNRGDVRATPDGWLPSIWPQEALTPSAPLAAHHSPKTQASWSGTSTGHPDNGTGVGDPVSAEAARSARLSLVSKEGHDLLRSVGPECQALSWSMSSCPGL